MGGASPATRSRRGRDSGEHVGPRPVAPWCPVPPLSCFSPFSSPLEHRPAEGSDPLAIDGPLLPCRCTLLGTAPLRDASVALKATSCQRLAPGIFPSAGVEGAPCPSPFPRTQGCSVPQFPWLEGGGIAAIQRLHPRAAGDEGAFPPPPAAQILPSEGSGPTQLHSWPPVLPAGSEPPSKFRVGMGDAHPKAPGFEGVHPRPPCPDGHACSPLWAAAHVAHNLGLKWD